MKKENWEEKLVHAKAVMDDERLDEAEPLLREIVDGDAPDHIRAPASYRFMHLLIRCEKTEEFNQYLAEQLHKTPGSELLWQHLSEFSLAINKPSQAAAAHQVQAWIQLAIWGEGFLHPTYDALKADASFPFPGLWSHIDESIATPHVREEVEQAIRAADVGTTRLIKRSGVLGAFLQANETGLDNEPQILRPGLAYSAEGEQNFEASELEDALAFVKAKHDIEAAESPDDVSFFRNQLREQIYTQAPSA